MPSHASIARFAGIARFALVPALALALLCAVLPARARAQQEDAPPERPAATRRVPAKAARKAAPAKVPTRATTKAPTKTRAAQAHAPAQKPALSAGELQAPYSAEAQTNATGKRLNLLDPDAPLGQAQSPAGGEGSSGMNLRLGRDQVIDPLTGKELTRRPDPAGAKEDLRNLRLKDAMDKLGGKAEVQVEILKF